MKRNYYYNIKCGAVLILAFIIWTVLIQVVDVQYNGVNGTSIGFATINSLFYAFTGVNISLYNITDWLGLIPVFVCMIFAFLGFVQLIKRKSLFKVDIDITITGLYYIAVIAFYFAFEMYPINYRPILINGYMEASYPSSTTLLVLCVMPTLVFQVRYRLKNRKSSNLICFFSVMFSVFMVAGRLISGVHWLTDIIGSCLLSAGLYNVYKGVVLWSLMRSCKN